MARQRAMTRSHLLEGDWTRSVLGLSSPGACHRSLGWLGWTDWASTQQKFLGSLSPLASQVIHKQFCPLEYSLVLVHWQTLKNNNKQILLANVCKDKQTNRSNEKIHYFLAAVSSALGELSRTPCLHEETRVPPLRGAALDTSFQCTWAGSYSGTGS